MSAASAAFSIFAQRGSFGILSQAWRRKSGELPNDFQLVISTVRKKKMKISEKRKNRSALHSLTQPTRFTFVKREGEALASGAEVNFLLKLPLYLLGVKPCTTS